MSLLAQAFADHAHILPDHLLDDGEADSEQNQDTEKDIAGQSSTTENVDQMTLEPEHDPMAAEMRYLERLLETNPAMAMYHAQTLSLAHGRHIDQDLLHEIYVTAYDKVLEQGGLSAVFHNTYNRDEMPFGTRPETEFDLGLSDFTPKPSAALSKPEPEVIAQVAPTIQQPQIQAPNPFMITPKGPGMV